MRSIIRLAAVFAVAFAGMTLWVPPAAANTKVTTVFHVDQTFPRERKTCGFPIRVHFFGSYRSTDYFDNTGFLYKTIITAGGGGRFSITWTANDTTLTMQMESAQVVVTYNRDGSIDTSTDNGIVAKFTTPGGGIVLLDAGRVTFDVSDGSILFEAGPHQQLHGDVQEFCAAFG